MLLYYNCIVITRVACVDVIIVITNCPLYVNRVDGGSFGWETCWFMKHFCFDLGTLWGGGGGRDT